MSRLASEEILILMLIVGLLAAAAGLIILLVIGVMKRARARTARLEQRVTDLEREMRQQRSE